jgi:hypothetical protein
MMLLGLLDTLIDAASGMDKISKTLESANDVEQLDFKKKPKGGRAKCNTCSSEAKIVLTCRCHATEIANPCNFLP